MSAVTASATTSSTSAATDGVGGNGRIAILDAGAQYGKVIDRRIRELCIECDLLPLDSAIERLSAYSALVISGGPQSVNDALLAPPYNPLMFDITAYDRPILGICYGMQLINLHFQGSIEKKLIREDGQFEIEIENERSALFQGLPSRIDALLTHGDSVKNLADELTAIGHTHEGLVTALQHRTRPIFGVQFHPEVDLTPQGSAIFVNFIERVCHLPRNFTLSNRLNDITHLIQEQVGAERHVLLLLSGGVDSSVCAALIKHAIGAERMHAIHIDNGFMRLNESSKVSCALEAIGLPVTVLHAQETFYQAKTDIKGFTTEALSITTNPEHIRKIIGDTFMRVSNEHIASLQLCAETTLLAQGTLRPDLIESASHLASSNADVIKTHHNDTQLVRDLRALGRIIEPLKDYHKDEVRLLGIELGLPQELVWRQPFPGPGLAIRIVCAQEAWKAENEAQLLQGLREYQSATINSTLLPCRTVGVQGDQRSYSSLVALSCDGEPDYNTLFSFAKAIPKRVHGVNRVVFVFGDKLPQGALNEITPTLLSKDTISQLQHADDIVNQLLLKHNLIRKLSQVPVVLLPVSFGVQGARSICIRTFITNDL